MHRLSSFVLLACVAGSDGTEGRHSIASAQLPFEPLKLRVHMQISEWMRQKERLTNLSISSIWERPLRKKKLGSD